MNSSISLTSILRLIVISLIMFILLAPFLWILLASFRPNMELIRNQTLIPQNITIENYISLFTKSAYWQWGINSTIVAVYTVILSLPLIVAGAYSVYRTQYRGRNVLSLFLLSVYIFPTALLVVPIFKIFDGLALVDSHLGCALMNTAFADPFGIWLLQAFLKSLPPELEEAAAVDGIGRIRTLFLIIIPQAAPGIIAIAMFAFIVSWTEYLFAMTLLLSNDLHTLPPGQSNKNAIMASVTLTKLNKKFGNTLAVKNVSVDIADGEFLVFVGPSGCGKTTTLRMVAGLESLSNGEIRIGDRIVNDLPPGDRDLAMVFQNYALYSHMTVEKNLGFALKARGLEGNEIEKRVQKVAQMLDLQEMLGRKPRQLSGGQRQRVAVGRAIVRNPQAFLMDEPLSNLDALLRLQTRKELIELTGELKSTVIYVTHDQVEAMTMGHRLAVKNYGEVVQLDTPENIFSRPSSRFVAEFIGSPPMNFLNVEIVEKNKKRVFQQDSFEVHVPDSMKALKETSVILGFRPNELELVSRGGISGTVSVVETLGSEKLVYLKLGEKTISLLVPTAEKIKSGENVRFKINPESLHLFNIANETRISFDYSV